METVLRMPIPAAADALCIREATLWQLMEEGVTSWVPINGRRLLEEHDLDRLTQFRAGRATGYVYVIGNTKRVKIGYTTGLRSRLDTIQTGFPDNLLIYAVIRGSRADEAEMHSVFAAHRVHGEWFKLTGRMRRMISEIRGRLSDTEVFGLLGHVGGLPA